MTPISPIFASVSVSISSSSIAKTCFKVSAPLARQKFQLPLLPSASSGKISPPPPSNRRILHLGANNSVLPLRHFILLSLAAALAFLTRRQGAKQYRVRQFMASATRDAVKSKAKRIDSHLHVWASPEEAKLFPYAPGQGPTLPGNAAYLVENMSEAGVDGALIIQPIDHKFDHRYVSSVLQEYPGKFVGCCLADPTDGGGGVRDLERLIKEEGYRAVRFNPYLWPPGQQMTNEVGKAMFSKAGELGAVVGFMCFKGLLLHIKDIEELCLEFPSTVVMIDHFGFCKPATNNEEAKAWEQLLGLARFPQVYVKVSAFFRISREPFPYKDTWPLVQELLTVFGAKRLLWGSDFPFVAAECGYHKANQDLPQLIGETLSVSQSDMDYLLGGTACRLFEGAWQESLLV
ncbi:unnamed protein product [Calypogeia fissa]